MIWALWGVKYFHSTEGVWNIGCCSVLARTMHAAQWQSLCCNWVLIFSRRSSSLLPSKRLLDYIQGTTSIWWCLTTNSELFLIQDHSLLIVHRDFISRLTDLRLCSHIHCIHYQRRNKIETNKNTNRDWTVAARPWLLEDETKISVRGERLNCVMGHDIRPQDDTMIQWYNGIIFDTSQSMSTRYEFLHTIHEACDANLLSVLRIENSHSIKSKDS